MLQASLAVFEQQPERWRQEIGTVLGDIGVVRELQERNDEAIRLFRQAIAIHEGELGPTHPILIRPLINLARVHAAAGRQDEADAIFPGCYHCGADVLMCYARFLRAAGYKRESKLLEARVRGVRQEIARRDGAGLTFDAS